MSVLRVDTDRYEESAALAATAGVRLADAVLSAGTILVRTGGMAGWDVMGAQWAASYDPAARDVVEACRAVALACSDTSRALTFAAGNYIEAEHIASMGVAPLIAPLLNASVGESAGACLPSAAEPLPVWPPEGWDLVDGLSGIAWPAGDAGLLKEAGGAWRTLTTDVDGVIAGPSRHARRIVDGLLAADLTLFRTRSDALDEACTVIAATSRDIADRCDTLATAIETAHQELREEALLFLADCAAVAAVGAALTFVTLGGSAAISALVGAARAAQMILRVQQIVFRLTSTARAVAVVAHRIPGAARLSSALRVLGRTPTALRSVIGATGRSGAAGSAIASGTRSTLAPSVRWVRPVVTASGRFLDSKPVSVALSSPSELLFGVASTQVRKRVLGTDALTDKAADLASSSAGGAVFVGVQGAMAISAVRRTLTVKERVDTAVGLMELPASLSERYAPGTVGALASGASGPGRLTAVRVPPVYGPTAGPSRGRRTTRPSASP